MKQNIQSELKKKNSEKKISNGHLCIYYKTDTNMKSPMIHKHYFKWHDVQWPWRIKETPWSWPFEKML